MPIPKEDIKLAVVALRDWLASPLPVGFRRYIHIEDDGKTIEIGEGIEVVKVMLR